MPFICIDCEAEFSTVAEAESCCSGKYVIHYTANSQYICYLCNEGWQSKINAVMCVQSHFRCQVYLQTNVRCSLPENAHTDPSLHAYVGAKLRARVAQPEEQGLRKSEAAGSTPVSSSKGFTANQRRALEAIAREEKTLQELMVHHANQKATVDNITRDLSRGSTILKEMDQKVKAQELIVSRFEIAFKNQILAEGPSDELLGLDEPETVVEEPEQIARLE